MADETTGAFEGPVAYLERGEVGERIMLELPATVGTGAGASCHIGGNPYIDRIHCQFLLASGRPMLKDLTCTPDRTGVNGLGLPSRGTRFIKPGATVTIGNEDFTFGGLLSEEETARYWEEKRARLEAEAQAAAEERAAEDGEAVDGEVTEAAEA